MPNQAFNRPSDGDFGVAGLKQKVHATLPPDQKYCRRQLAVVVTHRKHCARFAVTTRSRKIHKNVSVKIKRPAPQRRIVCVKSAELFGIMQDLEGLLLIGPPDEAPHLVMHRVPEVLSAQASVD